MDVFVDDGWLSLRVEGEGGAWSFTAAGGLAINIDNLDPSVKRRGDSMITSSYVFVELSNTMVLSDNLDTSDFQILAGLSLDFR